MESTILKGLRLPPARLRLETIKVLMGHSSIQTTQMYAKVETATAAATLSLLPWWTTTPASVEDEIAALRARLAQLEARGTDANPDFRASCRGTYQEH